MFQNLQNKILSGTIQSGENLPPERKLAEQLGVHRGVVREAIKRLEEKRLVRTRHGGGTKVLDFRAIGGLELLPTLASQSQYPDLDLMRSILEWRQDLASSMCRRIAQQQDPDALRPLYLIVDQMEISVDDLDKLQQLSLQFWDEMTKVSQNIAYQLAFNSLKDSYAPYQNLFQNELKQEFENTSAHRRLLQAIENRDANEASLIAYGLVSPSVP